MGGAATVAHTSFGVSRVYIVSFFAQFPNEDMTDFHLINSKLPFPHRILSQEESAWQGTWDFLALGSLRYHRKGLTMFN